MTIYIDAMGGDHAPLEIVKGAYLAAKEFAMPLTLIGDTDIIDEIVKKENLTSDKISLIDAKQNISMDEEPAKEVPELFCRLRYCIQAESKEFNVLRYARCCRGKRRCF